MHRIFVIGLIALSITACSKQPPAKNTPAAPGNTNQPASIAPATVPERKTGASPVKADFSNPKTVADTFVAAAQARDIEVLSQCFDPANPGEFQPLVDKTASENQLQKLASHFEGARVTTVQANGDDATARVALKDGEEDLTLRKTAAGWKIVNF